MGNGGRGGLDFRRARGAMRLRGGAVQLGLGLTFGALLASTGAADFDAMTRMFLFEEVHLFALAAATTLVAAIGLGLLLRSRFGEGVRARRRAIHRGSVVGGVVFGVGWGLSGTCPGTAFAQVGSGHFIAIATVAGILLGNWLYERHVAVRFGLSVDACG